MFPGTSGISPDLLTDKRFRIKKLEFSTYEVDGSNIKGQLRLVGVPQNVMEVPDVLIPPQMEKTPGLPVVVIASQTLISFTNRGKKGKPATKQLTPDEIRRAKKFDLTAYVIQDSAHEPWNEFILEGDPPILLRLRTVLTKLEWIVDEYNYLGDPSLRANSAITHSVSIASAGETGLT